MEWQVGRRKVTFIYLPLRVGGRSRVSRSTVVNSDASAKSALLLPEHTPSLPVHTTSLPACVLSFLECTPSFQCLLCPLRLHAGAYSTCSGDFLGACP